jgi:predicted molibdopterin-dependent oxidoreductase YjgC
MRLQVKGGEIIGSLPAEDPLVNNGQLCVKGRFCVTELVGNYQRLKKPYKTQNDTKVEISWEEAVDLAAEKLSACSGKDFGILVSPNCSNEDLYLAQKFTRVALGSHNIDTTARTFYGYSFNAYLDLARMGAPLSELRKASVILCIGLDTRFSRSVVGVELRKAIARGAKIVSINPRHHSLSVIAERWIEPAPGTEVSLLRSLVNLTQKKRAATTRSKSKGKSRSAGDELGAVAESLQGASHPVILVGSEFLQHDQSPPILEAIAQLARNLGAGILPLPAQNNLFGSILMGTYPELLPGGFSSGNKKRIEDLEKKWSADIPSLSSRLKRGLFSSEKKLKVLYLIGEVHPNLRSPSDFLISQNIYPPDPWHEADLALPSAAFTEVDGTFINGEGRVQRVRKAVEPAGEALPDWEILCRIAQKMGKKGFDFSSARQVHKEISAMVKGFGDFSGTKRKATSLTCEGKLNISPAKSKAIKKTDKKYPFLLNVSLVEHTHRGLPLSTWVEGARTLFGEGIVDINSEDARRAKISEGDEVAVTSAHFKRSWPARISSEQPRGTLHVTLGEGESLGPNPHPVRIRKKDV